ncbi:alpha/beta hydrolase [Kitasatospora aureofaciens]|uniref:alpha/beta hydrolase n=1 Tax=Kitasatospora aureofaciens TaxID=1894 RepID=UPI001C44372C|nr:alpha/beta hydrolase [Kitasatospora aureofaciens]MBV6701090.1 alpha/beta hydrolase family protein [Kitasatospora aureofaciens]
MDLASLKNANVADLYTLADAYDALCKAYTQHTADWKSGTADRVHGSEWTGPAATAAIPVLDGITDKLYAARIELSCIGTDLRDCADSFTLAQSKLRQALTDAQAMGMSVNECGAVSRPPAGSPYQSPAWEAKQKAAAEEIGKRINAALAEATRVDERLAESLKRYTGHANDKSGLDVKTASADGYLSDFAAMGNPARQLNMPGKDANPTEVNAWWKGLGPEGQQWFLGHHPEAIGNLDGVPAEVRDRVNRAHLEDLMQPIRNKNPKELNSNEKAVLALYGPIADRLAEDGNDPKRPQVFLLGLGSEGQGRAILSYGNPDTATDISAYVPGITTNTASLGKGDNVKDGSNEAENALNLYRTAAKKAPSGHSVASIVWLGYDPPGIDLGAASTKAGKDGAPAYANFLSGVRAGHEGRPPHITSIGHSYGSFLVGQATKLATQPGSHYAPPDDVVFLGSPGIGVDKASDLRMPPGRVWVGAADNDFVTRLPSKFSIDPDERWYGRDPASKHFDAHRFTVDNWSEGNPVDAHTKYLSPHGGPSLDNIAAIVTGSGDVKLAGRR